MPKFIKFILISVMATMLAFMLYGLAKITFGNYMVANPFNYVFIVLLVALGVYSFIKGIKVLRNFCLIGLLVVTQSCNYAKSNQQVVVSDDCGMNWKKINAGDAVPRSGVNPCYMKVVIPNYPMQGESKFISNLKGKVRVGVHIDYDYSITNSLAFIKQAKYLGKANSDADSGEALDNKAFEGAENSVIDKRIREVAKAIFLAEDILELDQAELENRLQAESNKVLEQFGVYLNFITLTFELDEQTRQAIDVSTAMKIYASKGLEDVGKQVMIQRAGATKVVVENKVSEATKTEQ